MKSGYWLGAHLSMNDPPIPTYGNAELKHKVWKTKAPAKLKHFLWRLLSKSLATSNNLKRRLIVQNDQCRRCWSAIETEMHIFFECPYASKIWRASGVSNLIISNPNASLEEKIEACTNFFYQIVYLIFKTYLFGCYGDFGRAEIHYFSSRKKIHWRNLLRYAHDDVRNGSRWILMEARINMALDKPHMCPLDYIGICNTGPFI